jgi:hypothetical protein
MEGFRVAASLSPLPREGEGSRERGVSDAAWEGRGKECGSEGTSIEG